MSGDLVLRADLGAVTILTMNAPARLNALSGAMLAALDAAFSALGPDCRVVVLRGGEKAFSAGHDLREIQGLRADADGGRARMAALFSQCTALMQKIGALPQVVIAEVAGVATAAGCQLAASCDLVVAAETARFGVNGINIGLFCSTPMVALIQKVPPAQALEYLLTGEMFDAARAQAMGLVTRVVPAAELTQASLGLAQVIAGKLPAAVRHGKAAFRAVQGLAPGPAYAVAAPIICANLMEPETAEGIQAFLEKRKPSWA